MKSIVLTLALCSLAIGCNTRDTESAPRWPRSIEPRLSGSQWRPCTTKADCGPTTLAPVACKDVILTVNKARQLLLTQPRCTSDAVKALEQIALSHPEADNDLAAAYYVRAQREDRPVDLLSAFDAVAKAPRSPESLFNRALIEEALYLRDDAMASWDELLKVDRTQWAAEARAHRDALARQVDGVTQWERNQAELANTRDPDRVVNLIAPFPDSATKWFEEHPVADLASVFSRITRDRYPFDIANAAPRSPHAQQAFVEARSAAAALKPALAAAKYKEAIPLLERAASPLALAARIDYASRVGNYERTLQLLEQIEPEVLKHGYAQLVVRLHAARANALYWLGRYVESLLEYDTVADESSRLGNEEDVGWALERRAGVYRMAGANQRGWRDLIQAFRFSPHIGALRDQNVLLGEAATAATELDHAQAAMSYNRASFRLLSENEPSYALALRDRAAIELDLGQTSAAIADIDAARQMNEKVADEIATRILRARTEQIAGRTMLKAANTNGAVAAFTRALDAASPRFPTFRATVLSERADAYRRAGHSAQADNDLLVAVKELEQEGSGILKRRKPGEGENVWSAYFSRFQSVYQTLIREYVLQQRIAGALDYAERARSREPLNLAHAAPTFDLATLQRALLPDTVLLEYAVLDDRTIVWIIRPERLDAMTLDAPRAKVVQWTAAVQSNNAADFANALDAAYDGLVERPLAAIGAAPARLVIIPDTEMQGLPFAALHDSKSKPNRYLIERSAVEIEGSAALYLLSLQRDQALPRDRSLLLVGNPTRDLPRSREEVQRIASLYGPDARALLEDDATAEHFLQQGPAASIVHVAAHSTFDVEAPFQSSIAFASSSLHAYELVTRFHPTRTRLIVLSSCSSAGGGPVGPEGVAPLVRPLITAGVPAIIGSLWQIPDNAPTEELLVSFHQRYRNGDDAAVALQRAQIEMLRKTRNAGSTSARAWGAFQVIGHGSSPFAPRAIEGETTVTSFILKLFFSGMMAFVPNQDGTEVTVLLLNVDHNHQLSDGSTLEHHMPLLLARAGDCSGDCPTRDSTIAQHMFSEQSAATALDSLEAAVTGGGAWLLSGSELSVEKGSASDPALPALDIVRNVRNGIIPTTSAEREDFDWLADLSQIAPSGYTLDSDVLASPPPGLIAARFHIRNGKVFTYRLARIGSDVTPVHFQRLDGSGSIPSYSQAVTTWIGAEIEVSGDNVQIVEEKFDESSGRSMTLTPNEAGQVEIAVINLPPLSPPSTQFSGTPGAGKHFENYYDLAESPIAQSARLVPKPGAAPGAPSYSQVSWDAIHPQTALWSDLLNALRLNIGRAPYDELLCPPTRP